MLVSSGLAMQCGLTWVVPAVACHCVNERDTPLPTPLGTGEPGACFVTLASLSKFPSLQSCTIRVKRVKKVRTQFSSVKSRIEAN